GGGGRGVGRRGRGLVVLLRSRARGARCAAWMPPPQRGGIRSTMVHDLVPLRFPEWVQGRTKRMHGAKYANAARTCDVIFVNSEFTKGEVVELLGVAPKKVVVAYPGADGYSPAGERADLGR